MSPHIVTGAYIIEHLILLLKSSFAFAHNDFTSDSECIHNDVVEIFACLHIKKFFKKFPYFISLNKLKKIFNIHIKKYNFNHPSLFFLHSFLYST